LARGRRSTSLGCASLEVAHSRPRARSLGGCASLQGRLHPRRRALAHSPSSTLPNAASFAASATSALRTGDDISTCTNDDPGTPPSAFICTFVVAPRTSASSGKRRTPGKIFFSPAARADEASDEPAGSPADTTMSVPAGTDPSSALWPKPWSWITVAPRSARAAASVAAGDRGAGVGRPAAGGGGRAGGAAGPAGG